MTTAILKEAGSESLYGQIAVGWIILNRLDSGKYGKDICSIVYSKEFQFKKSKGPVKDWRRREAFASLIMKRRFVDPTKGAIFFQRVDAKRWAKHPCNTTVIGHHKFFNVCN